MTVLVIGPSSAGKTTYLESIKAADIYFANQLSDKNIPESGYIHYNLLQGVKKYKNEDHFPREWDLMHEPILKKILDSGRIKKVIILVTPLHELIKRITKRDIIEPSLKTEIKYPSNLWKKICTEIDLNAVYYQLFDLLKTFSLTSHCILSSENAPDDYVADKVYIGHYLRGEFPRSATQQEVVRINEMPGAQYQAVDLPHGMISAVGGHKHLNGSRDSTFSKIRNVTYQDKTVLDIGCAQGDILFRSERLGAKKIVGVDIKQDRHDAAKAIGSILHSRAEFLLGDFLDFEFPEKFDDVYALNVIHHISDIRRFILKAANLTKRRLIIEFPTLNDPKFNRLASMPANLDSLPLMGVSHSKIDQTFTFTPAAVQMMVSEAGDFTHELLESPIKGRKIMVFSPS